jgi:serine/threonine protein kinase, bacterial
MSDMDQRLGSRYVLKERLGRGAMGTVWRAQNTDTGQFVAVKVLSEELSDEPDMVTRFIQERNTLIAVLHPNLVRIHDLVVEDGRLAIVMDLVNGPDLHRHLVDRGVLSLSEAAVIGRGVASALTVIHTAGIIHRDLKPANILLDLGGPQPQPKLVDFGIARMLAGSRLTARSSVVGTPQYLSPEAISGTEPSPALDIYAFGIALYELLTGKPPFYGEQLLQVLNQHMYQEPPWPASIPPEILPVLQAMLAKNPQSRPTAEQLTQALDEVVANAPAPIFPALAPAPYQQQSQRPWQSGPAPQSPLPTPGAGAGPQSPVPSPGQQPLGSSPLPQQSSPLPGTFGNPGQSPLAPQNSPLPGIFGAPGQSPLPPQSSPLPAPGPQSPLPQTPPGYPAAPNAQPFGAPTGTPLPGAPGSPLPGAPARSPIPAPSPSGFFYPNAGMFDPNASASSFPQSPPPFTDEMFSPKKPKRDKRKLALLGGGGVAVLAVVGLVLALTLGGGNSPNPQPGASGTGAAVVAVQPCPAETAVGVQAAARWTLAGSAGDCSLAPSNANSLTLAGGATYVDSGARGKVLAFEGGSAVASVRNNSIVNTASSFTVSIWVDLQSYSKSKYSTVLAFQGSSVDAYTIEYNPGWGGWAFNHTTIDGSGASWVAAAAKTAPKTNTWTHLVGVYNSSSHTLSLFENGTKVVERTGITGWNGDSKITLGANSYPSGAIYTPMTGELSDLQIFDSALTATQVAAIQ